MWTFIILVVGLMIIFWSCCGLVRFWNRTTMIGDIDDMVDEMVGDGVE